ncbi:GNAT family N-acetyltransferase [Cellulomonas hominis]|uniref:GNAT family N-acetyltransferase n=1 Tax=Cellulomonas hominis TaxID=156981 RepID=UPI001C101AFE|nr:GNAT family N-acetyltransferase [Cellulomonas hominis]MBU5421241.1 GNAT family N-acetyltransferase [Cellulomonas hominis]
MPIDTTDDAVRIRHATPEDAAALVGLRALMLTEMGSDPGPADSPWRAAAHAWFTERLSRGTVVAVVAEHPVDGVVASAVGAVEQHAPSPSSPDGAHGRVSTVVTHPAHRGHGLARRCTVALLDRLRAETTVRVVELNATAPAEAIYRDLGFHEPRFVALQARVR